MHAAINWYMEGDPFANLWVQSYSVEDAASIISQFVHALRESMEGGDMVGDLDHVYATGVSFSSGVLAAVLDTDYAAGLFDFSLLNVPKWHGETHEKRSDIGKVLTVLTEADIVNAHLHGLGTQLLRGSTANYRSYEFAGAPHIPDTPMSRAAYGALVMGTNPLNFIMSVHALFMAGHNWVTRGVEPPPSYELDAAIPGEVDAVYGLETGIARDDMNNALGGVRLPDLAIGRGQYIAVVPTGFMGLGLVGSFVDMKCDLLPNGTPRFASQGEYVSQFAQVTEDLVAEGFLLQQEAADLIQSAAESELCMHNRAFLPALIAPAVDAEQ
jgi:hypothetical protein